MTASACRLASSIASLSAGSETVKFYNYSNLPYMAMLFMAHKGLNLVSYRQDFQDKVKSYRLKIQKP